MIWGRFLRKHFGLSTTLLFVVDVSRLGYLGYLLWRRSLFPTAAKR